MVYTFQEDREYNAPKEQPLDGFLRLNWQERKEAGKDQEYAQTVKEFKARTQLQEAGQPDLPSGQTQS